MTIELLIQGKNVMIIPRIFWKKVVSLVFLWGISSVVAITAYKSLASPVYVDEVPPLPVADGTITDLEDVTSPDPNTGLLGQGGAFPDVSNDENPYQINEGLYIQSTENVNLTLENVETKVGDTQRPTRRFPFAQF